MTLFLRRGRPRLGAGFRPALIRFGQQRPQAVASPKLKLSTATKTELKTLLDSLGISYASSLTKSELLALARTV